MKRTLIRFAAAVLCLTALPWSAHPKATGATVAALTPSGPRIEASSAGIAPDVLQLALGAVSCATRLGDIKAPATLTVIDYSRPSVEQRLWVFDMRDGSLLFRELVAHGRNTGENIAMRFSDAMNSLQSSIGLFVTADTYVGTNGYSLRLDGLERGFNSHARDRAIVMHGAPYVDASLAATHRDGSVAAGDALRFAKPSHGRSSIPFATAA